MKVHILQIIKELMVFNLKKIFLTFFLMKGYGRNEKESNINCIRNLFEFLLDDEKTLILFKDSLKMSILIFFIIKIKKSIEI